jgi:hypothetical protein
LQASNGGVVICNDSHNAIKVGKGCAVVYIRYDTSCSVAHITTAIGGEDIKADRWHIIVDDKFVEVDDEYVAICIDR